VATPKISLNKLAEYLTATPMRRRRIVLDQQDPKAFLAARYIDSRAVIVEALSSRRDDPNFLNERALDLRLDDSGSKFSCDDRMASANAIDCFAECLGGLDLRGLIATPVEPNFSAAMAISGVRISIRPDLIISNAESGEIVGAIKLNFSKSTPLCSEAMDYVGVILRTYMESSGDGCSVDSRRCYVVDVQSKRVGNSPRATKRRMQDVEAACDEIFARWTGVGRAA
jgi:hypothetical protein